MTFLLFFLAFVVFAAVLGWSAEKDRQNKLMEAPILNGCSLPRPDDKRWRRDFYRSDKLLLATSEGNYHLLDYRRGLQDYHIYFKDAVIGSWAAYIQAVSDNLEAQEQFQLRLQTAKAMEEEE